MLLPIVAFLAASHPQIQEDLPALGTNLATVSESSTQWPFVDVFKCARPWASQGAGGSLDVDENGNVKSLKPGQTAATAVFTSGHYPQGAYTLLWDGDGDFDASGGNTLQAADKGKATVNVAGDAGIMLTLKRVNPADPPRNIRLVMPGHEDSFSSEPFHPVFLQRMSLYRCLRFKDWGRVDGSQARQWSDRAMPSSATFASAKGVPYEAMLDLCNAKTSMPWICVPHMADDDYVRKLATLVQTRLRPGLRIVVEYSNECWNPSLPQSQWCVEQGKRLKLSDDAAEAGLRFYAQRSVEVFSIFESVLGGRNRLVRVLGAPYGDRKAAETVIGWKNAYVNADGLAVAPYFGRTTGTAEKPDSLDTVFAALKGEVGGPIRDRLFELAGLASQNRLRLIAYEGGQHLASDASDPGMDKLFDEANRDERMGETYTAFLKAWRTAGGSMFVHYVDCAPFTGAGRYGTIEYQNQDPQSSFKNQALIQYALFPDR